MRYDNVEEHYRLWQPLIKGKGRKKKKKSFYSGKRLAALSHEKAHQFFSLSLMLNRFLAIDIRNEIEPVAFVSSSTHVLDVVSTCNFH